ncbi:MAG: hypothetical protein ACFBSG_14060 [Leptolyngbyaceae cyanobacterium]
MSEMIQIFDFLFLLVYRLVQLIQPILVPICFVVAWATVLFGVWSLWSTLRNGVRRAQKMHQIPCADCQYFSGNYFLKCPLHPKEALSEAAIHCGDFEANRLDVPSSDANLIR